MATIESRPVGDKEAFFDDFKAVLAGAVISTLVYGLNLRLSIACLLALYRTVTKRPDSTKKRLMLYCLYICAMLGLATHALAHANQALVVLTRAAGGRIFDSVLRASEVSLRNDALSLFNILVPNTFPSALWGADGLLIWRCCVLYEGVSRRIRAGLFAVLGLLSVFSIGALGSWFKITKEVNQIWQHTAAGVYAWKTNNLPPDLQSRQTADIWFNLLVLPGTFSPNIVVSGLIAGRLLYAHRLLVAVTSNQVMQNQENSPYITALAICIESSALMTVVSLAAFLGQILTTSSYQFPWYPAAPMIPEMILPQICVTSPLLIAHRVLRGRSNNTIARLEGELTRSISFRRTTEGGTMSETTI